MERYASPSFRHCPVVLDVPGLLNLSPWQCGTGWFTGSVYQLGPIRVADLPAIGTAFQGGYYAGLISHTANGVATHALIISPKALGSALNVAWKTAISRPSQLIATDRAKRAALNLANLATCAMVTRSPER